MPAYRFGSKGVDSERLVSELRDLASPLRGAEDLDPLLARIGDARYALLGEASHGTSEYYTWRAEISKRLVEERGFSFIAVEGDWPDCYRVNQYVKGHEGAGVSAREVLHAFDRWPTWMWANEEVVELAEWMRGYNEGRPEEEKVGFYGLDVYSLWQSLNAIVQYLEEVDHAAVEAARDAFRCFEPYGEEVERYARAASLVPESCEGEVLRLLTEVRAAAEEAHLADRDAFFNAEQNALVLRNAEHYYRIMMHGGPESWNLRDHHMVETLERLMAHHGERAKAIVWEHNTHIGDARYTDMIDDGMVNVGQLVRETHAPEDVALVGFGSYRGSVIASAWWGAPMHPMPVPEAVPGSIEAAMHEAGPEDKLYVFGDLAESPLMSRIGHRAIGVVYAPDRERFGNYVPTVLPKRYDAFLYIDETRALRPLHLEAHLYGEAPETYPTGL